MSDTSGAMPHVDVVVVNHNTCALLRRCLESLTSGGHRHRVIVVDNGSSDGSSQVVRREFPDVALIEGANVGYGQGANAGIARCGAPVVVVLNADVMITPADVDRLATYLGDHPDVAVVGPRIVDAFGGSEASVGSFPTVGALMTTELGLWKLVRRIRPLSRLLMFVTPTRSGPVDWVLGAVLAIRRVALPTDEIFDPRYFLYFEEVDLCRRLAEAGWGVHWLESAVAQHLGGASTTSHRGANAMYFRSLAVYTRRWCGELPWKVRTAVVTIALVKGSRAAVMERDRRVVRSWSHLALEAARGWS